MGVLLDAHDCVKRLMTIMHRIVIDAVPLRKFQRRCAAVRHNGQFNMLRLWGLGLKKRTAMAHTAGSEKMIFAIETGSAGSHTCWW